MGITPPREQARGTDGQVLGAQPPAADPLSAAWAFRWRERRLQPITHVQAVALDALLGIERQKQALLDNTQRFVAGLPANHALLTGARGTGKSSLVKAMLQRFGDQGLRLVEVPPHDLIDLPDIVAPLRERSERFVLYVDDFSVAANDPALMALKTALDGGVEAPPDNVLIYATSNRRHLMPESRRDNAEYHWVDDELHPGESTEEKISLSERFGLWLSFQPFDQERYLELVRLHLAALGDRRWDETTEKLALRWALERASRSGRVAQQFARHWAGR
ncbi:ATP-binding protein [Sinimarinibacterium thermocellulolyticum]|uniref:ATP-binding protein n=1 Tax=Sinimarinibacterium thermocellulolyticum TaxID=3170016 RepID=A0ABV2A5B2_9GAMM